VPVKTEQKPVERAISARGWAPIESLHREIDRLFEDFDRRGWLPPFRRSIFDIEPLWRREIKWQAAPSVDIVEAEGAYEVTAELPGIDAKDIEVKLVNDELSINGEKQEEKEEKKKDYYLRERTFGSFERRFALPDAVDTEKIEARFNNGVLTVMLPKKTTTIKPAETITVKQAAL
jgi:HSP20 family protein